MGPLPKKKISPSRRNKRRAHDALTLKQLAKCETCGAYHLAHHVCMKCGSYRGVTVLDVKKDD
ncbi:MAG: 50S ribosomal protein L32 [Pleurocapsa minor GSE-CHR-MK-17-07R]|nr:50S ribosomal protein L32 [Pleurocapsa minor GSE-CHR-MK 17-07R]